MGEAPADCMSRHVHRHAAHQGHPPRRWAVATHELAQGQFVTRPGAVRQIAIVPWLEGACVFLGRTRDVLHENFVVSGAVRPTGYTPGNPVWHRSTGG